MKTKADPAMRRFQVEKRGYEVCDDWLTVRNAIL